jgi:hypothetical protein
LRHDSDEPNPILQIYQVFSSVFCHLSLEFEIETAP